MNCPKCGSKINTNQSYCQNCGNMIPNTIKNNKFPWKPVIIIVIGLLIIIGIVVTINTMNDIKKDTKNTKIENIDKEKITKTIKYNDYTFTTDKETNIETKDKQLVVSYDDKSWGASIQYEDSVDYDTLITKKETLQQTIENQMGNTYDFSNSTIEEKTYNNMNFLIINNIKQDNLALELAYGKTDVGVFVISISKNKDTITELEREKIYTLVSTAKKN